MTKEADNQGGAIALDPHANPGVWVPRLTRVLDRQIELYERLEELSLRQAGLLDGEQPDALLDVLAQRQVLIQQVTDLNARLEPFTQRWADLAARLSPAQRTDIGNRTGRLDELIKGIADRDEEARRTLESRRAEVSSRIASASSQRAAVAAYRGASGAPASPRFQDREG